MAGTLGQTPSVRFTLDDSETMRLEKLRAHLKLAHWVRIGKEFELQADDAVAKSIKAVETTDPVAYDEQYAPWFNRYSDFKMSWVKTRNEETNDIEGQLIATGRPRIEHLGKIGEGSKVTLMKGPILTDPLPTVEVGDLRINHLLMEINFVEPVELDDNTTAEKSFKVGHRNKLFGKKTREENKKTFKDKQAEKKGIFTKAMLQNLLKGMAEIAVEEKTPADVEEDISDLEDNKNNELDLVNAGPAHPLFNQPFKPTPEQNKVKDLVRVTVGPTHGGPDHTQAE